MSKLILRHDTVENINHELLRAKEKFPDNFNSYHEGYAVLKEEVDELWDEVKLKTPDRLKIYNEAKQVACMAIRIMQEF